MDRLGENWITAGEGVWYLVSVAKDAHMLLLLQPPAHTCGASRDAYVILSIVTSQKVPIRTYEFVDA